MNRCLVWLTLVGMTVSAFGRNPDELDTNILLRKAVTAIKEADAKAAVADEALMQALNALEELQKKYPRFQPDLVAARVAECRRRLAAQPQDDAVSTQTPSTLALAKQNTELLTENQALRRLLQAARVDAKPERVNLSPDLLKALETVSKQAKEIDALKETAARDVNSARGALAKRRKELDDLSERNLDLLASNGGLQEKLKKQVQEYDALKKAKFRELDELKELKRKHAETVKALKAQKGRNETLKAALDAIDAGDRDELKKSVVTAVESEVKKTQALVAEQAKVEALKAEKVRQKQQMDVMQLSNAKLREELRLLKMGVETVIIEELERRVKTLKDELRDTQEKVVATEALATAKDDLIKAAHLARPVPDQSRDAKALLAAKAREIDAFQEVVEALKAENDNLRATLAESKTATVAGDGSRTVPEALTDTQQQELQILVQQAGAAMALGDADTAKGHCAKALKIKPNDVDASLIMAEILMKVDDPSGAGLHLSSAIDGGVDAARAEHLLQDFPNSPASPLNWLALAYRIAGKRPKNPAVNRFVAKALRAGGAPELAEAQLLHTWTLADDFDTAKALAELYQSRGKAYDKQRKQWYDKALEVSPDRQGELNLIKRKGTME